MSLLYGILPSVFIFLNIVVTFTNIKQIIYQEQQQPIVLLKFVSLSFTPSLNSIPCSCQKMNSHINLHGCIYVIFFIKSLIFNMYLNFICASDKSHLNSLSYHYFKEMNIHPHSAKLCCPHTLLKMTLLSKRTSAPKYFSFSIDPFCLFSEGA